MEDTGLILHYNNLDFLTEKMRAYQTTAWLILLHVLLTNWMKT